MPKNNSPTILLAEDDQFLQRMYSTKLRQQGMKVITASDGEKAVSLIQKHKPDIILLDILMPKKDGFVVLEEIKSDSKIKLIPVILLTNLSEVDDIKRARKLGADDYLIKSHFLPSEVIEVLRKYL
jgi:DNA-binding response OmpR family regulator|tara:strand:- start:399 stop:776 length:378 start_codon:yes stop_codon:yes gene_type:complete